MPKSSGGLRYIMPIESLKIMVQSRRPIWPKERKEIVDCFINNNRTIKTQLHNLRFL